MRAPKCRMEPVAGRGVRIHRRQTKGDGCLLNPPQGKGGPYREGGRACQPGGGGGAVVKGRRGGGGTAT